MAVLPSHVPESTTLPPKAKAAVTRNIEHQTTWAKSAESVLEETVSSLAPSNTNQKAERGQKDKAKYEGEESHHLTPGRFCLHQTARIAKPSLAGTPARKASMVAILKNKKFDPEQETSTLNPKPI